MLSFRTTTLLTFYATFIWLSSGFTSIRYEYIDNNTSRTFRFRGNEELRKSEEISVMEFDDIIEKVLQHEGGYVNDKDDLGGETNYGIT